MKNKVMWLMFLVSGFFFTSCDKVTGEGPVVDETRAVINFEHVSSSLGGDVVVEQGAVYSLKISAQRNVLDVIQAIVSGNELVLKFKNGTRLRKHEAIRVHLVMPLVSGLAVSGSGNMTANGNLKGNLLKLRISGSGNLIVEEAEKNRIESEISGSGNITVKAGTANESNLTISGSGSIDMQHVEVKDVTTHTSGSGSMRVWATEHLWATISGSGTVYYKGTPDIDSRISGSGRVTKQN